MRKPWFWILTIPVLIVGVLIWSAGRSVDIPKGSYLVVELKGDYAESANPTFFDFFFPGSSRPFSFVLSELSKVERDDRVAGVLLKIRDLEIGWAKGQEVRAAIQRLSGKGLKVVAYLETETLSSNLEYYVASAADEVYLAPGMRNPLIGLAAEYFFLGDFFEQFGVSFEYERIGSYKTAVETLTRETMSDQNREMTEWLINSINSQFVNGISQSRNIAVDEVEAAIEKAPVSLNKVQELGLIDGISSFSTLVDNLGVEVINARDYAEVDIEDLGFSADLSIAVVYANGPVVTGKGTDRINGSTQINSELILEALEDITHSDDIDAVILRIDSPGGSALASDIIWDAVSKVREVGIPVIASLSDVAASGGYYIASGADIVVASPGTITGSIGVFVLRPVLEKLLKTLKIGTAHETRGDYAELSLLTKPLSVRGRKRLQEEMKQVYERFLNRVSQGRKLSKDSVDLNGRGRVFTGIQAKRRGLVDVLGGMDIAISEATRLLGYEEPQDVLLISFPRQKSLVQQLGRKILSGASDTILSENISQIPRGLWEVSRVPVGSPVLFSTVIPHIR